MRLTLVVVDAEAFVSPLGWQVDLVAICRAFHRLSQEVLLGRFDAQIAPGGVVAVFGQQLLDGRQPLEERLRSILKDFVGEQPGGQGTFKHLRLAIRRLMEESPFSKLEEWWIPVGRAWNAGSIPRCLCSTSFTAPRLFGDRLPAFEAAVTAELACSATRTSSTRTTSSSSG